MQVRVHNRRRGNNRPQQRSPVEVALSAGVALALRHRVLGLQRELRFERSANCDILVYVPSFISAAADLSRRVVSREFSNYETFPRNVYRGLEKRPTRVSFASDNETTPALPANEIVVKLKDFFSFREMRNRNNA